MHCDLSLEALFKLARRNDDQVCISDLNIRGLKAEHLAPAVAKGWLLKTPAPRYMGMKQRTHAPHYAVTDAGRQHLSQLVTHSISHLLPTTHP
jgi:hypothetical protein